MYSEWASLSPVIAANSNNSANTVLNKFSSVAGKEVSQAVVKQLAANLGITQPPEPSILVTDEEVSQYDNESLLMLKFLIDVKLCFLFDFYHLSYWAHTSCELPVRSE